MIIRGGFKIYPREVEEVLYTHPAVQEVAIVGLPDPVLGEINCACIKLKEDFQVITEEIIEFCKDKLILGCLVIIKGFMIFIDVCNNIVFSKR